MADAIIGKIRAIITADTSGLSQGVAAASKSLDSLGSTAESTAGKVSHVTDALKPEAIAADTAQASQSLTTLTQAAARTESQLEQVSEGIDGQMIQQEVNQSVKGLEDLSDAGVESAGKMNATFKQLANTMAVAFGSQKLISFIKDSVKGASDLGEAMNVTNEIFESGAETIKDFSRTAAVSLGQSTKTALDGANTFATFGKSAGLAGEDLSAFAIKFSTLASDLASFRNTTPEDAIQAIGAALRGESEPIRRYGVMLNEASLQQEALKLGIISSTKDALTPQQKVLAASAAIFTQTKDAQGDFARTSDGLANSSRILTAQITDLKAGMGEALLPTVEALVGVMNPLVGSFNAMDESSKTVVSVLALITSGVVLAQRALIALNVEMVTAAGTATIAKTAFMGFYAAAAGIGLGFALGEGVNKITGATEKASAALQELLGTLDDVSRYGTIEAFSDLAEQEASTWRLSNAWEMFGKSLTVNGISLDLESYDAAFNKIMESGPGAAQATVDAMKNWVAVQTALTAETGITYDEVDDLQQLIDRYQGKIDLAAAATSGLASVTGEGTQAIMTQADALAGTIPEWDDYRIAILGAAGAASIDLKVALNEAILGSRSFVESMSDGKVSSEEFENAIISQAEEMLKLQFSTKGQTDKIKQVIPAMRTLMDSMFAAGAAQGKTREQTQQLIESLGLLEGIDPRIAIYLTMDVSQIEAQVKQLEGALAAAKRTGNMSFYGGVFKELEAVRKVLAGIQQIDLGAALSGGGGGGGGGSPKPDAADFSWVDGWVNDIADYANGLISTSFRDALLSGSAKEIGKALEATLEEATRLGLQNLPQFAGFIDKIKEQFGRLGDLANLRDSLTIQLNEAKKSLDKLKSTLDSTAEAAGRFDSTITGSTAPLTTLLDKALAAQATLDDLKLKLDEAAQAAGKFDSTITGSTAPLNTLLDKALAAEGALDGLQNTLNQTAQAAGKFDSTITGSQAPSNTLLDQALAAQKKYDELFSKSESLKQQQSNLAKSVSDSVLQPITARNPLGNTRKLLQQATAFRDNLSALRDKGFGPDIIGQVAQAGILEGNKIAKSLLNLSSGDIAELTQIRTDIAAIGAEAGEIAASVIFGADIANAEGALDEQRSLVRTLFNNAIGEARSQFEAQQALTRTLFTDAIAEATSQFEAQRALARSLFTDAVAEAQAKYDLQKTLVDGLEVSLATANTQMANLVYAIQVDLYNTMFGFLAGFNGGIDKLKGAPTHADPVMSIPKPPTIPPAPAPVVSAPAMPNLPINIDFGAIGETMLQKIKKFKPGQLTGWNDGPLPNGGAIVGGRYLPPGLDFSGFHAEGGITTGASIGVIGEKGPEAIIPLSRMGEFGGSDTYITVNVSGSVTSERDLVEQIRQGLIRAQKSGKALIV
jgi:hypothetical protein